MFRTLFIGGFLTLTFLARAAEPVFSHEVAQWQEVTVPSAWWHPADRRVFFYAANYSKHVWRVSTERGQVVAHLYDAAPPDTKERPTIALKDGSPRSTSVFTRVEDGWLVGFNEGEFGAAFYWYSLDEKQRHKISNHHVISFFSRPDGVFAIEGLAHMMTSRGTLLRIHRPQGQWQASTVTQLPSAPHAVSVRSDNTTFITLADSLISVGPDFQITTLLSDPPWTSLYPTSSVLSADENKLYIGMHQFVGEFDLRSQKLRLLVPSSAFLNKLPKDREQRIRNPLSWLVESPR